MNSITGLILAGGRATRMGGKDKGLIEVAGKPMAQRIAEQLMSQVDEVLINANRHLSDYRALGYGVISDELAGFQGPLAGMLSGIEKMQSEWLLTAPCDGPYLDPHYADSMLSAAGAKTEGTGRLLVVARDSDRLQPVYCLINRQLGSSLLEFLESGDRKIDRWFARHNYAEVTFDQTPSMFTNINTPEELAQINARW